MDDDDLIIMAIDPGGTSGYVVLRWDGDNQHLPQPESLLASGQIDYDHMPGWLDEAIGYHRPDLIVYERFNISPRTIQHSRQPEALYVIGGILFLAKLAGIETREQNSNDAKTAYTNDRLTEWEVSGRHAKDALRHALLSCHRRVVRSPVQT